MTPTHFTLTLEFQDFAQAHDFMHLVMKRDKKMKRGIVTEMSITYHDKTTGGAYVTIESIWADNLKGFGKLLKLVEKANE